MAYDEQPPILECKKGELRGLDCVDSKHEEPEIKCPKEYKLQNGVKCVHEKKTKADYVCATGTLHGKECIYDLTTPPSFSCKKDFQLIGGKCVKVMEESPTPVCQKGYKFAGGVCTQEVKAKADEICPDGSPANGECTDYDIAEPEIYCKKDATLLNNGTCRTSSKHGVEMKCPKDYKMDGGVCLAVTKVKPHEECPESVTTVNAEVYCKKGNLTGDGNCVSNEYREPKHECPKGFKLDGKNCSKEYTVAGVDVCENGTFKGGKCEVNIKTAPTMHCKKEYVLNTNGMCGKSVTEKGSLTCPGGYILKEGVCHRESALYFVETSGTDYHVKKEEEKKHDGYGLPEGHTHH